MTNPRTKETLIVPIVFQLEYISLEHRVHLLREIARIHLDMSGSGSTKAGGFFSYSVKCRGPEKELT